MSNVGVIDLTGYKDRFGSNVAEGRYRVQVEDAEWGESSQKNPMITLWLRIVGGEFDGYTLVDRLTLTDNSMFRVVNFLQGLGLQTPRKRLQVDISKWVGKVLDVDVADGQPYNGRVRSEIKGYMRVQSAPAVEDSDGLEEFMSETTTNPAPIEEAAAQTGGPDITAASVSVAEEIDLDSISL